MKDPARGGKKKTEKPDYRARNYTASKLDKQGPEGDGSLLAATRASRNTRSRDRRRRRAAPTGGCPRPRDYCSAQSSPQLLKCRRRCRCRPRKLQSHCSRRSSAPRFPPLPRPLPRPTGDRQVLPLPRGEKLKGITITRRLLGENNEGMFRRPRFGEFNCNEERGGAAWV